MVNLNIRGVPVSFPFDPYDVQVQYMEKVIESLQSGANALLESPTGTGKTLCLLCSSLAWLSAKKAQLQSTALLGNSESSGIQNDLAAATGLTWGTSGTSQFVPKIIYASRTHSQLTQVIQELKRTTYSYMKASIMGSRDQLCIHPEVSKELNNSVKLHMCYARVQSKSCHFHNNLEAKKEEKDFKDSILDIEDLIKAGKAHRVCPYYMTKEIKRNADIIFMPYNYLLDPAIRKIHGIELEGNIVIFDEAHNVEKMCEDAASVQLKSLDVALCIEEVSQVIKKMTSDQQAMEADFGSSDTTRMMDFTLEELCILKAMFLNLEKEIDAIAPPPSEGITFPGDYMLKLLATVEITPEKRTVVIELVDKLVQYLTVAAGTGPFQRKGAGLQVFANLLKIVFAKDKFSLEHLERVKRSYKVHIQMEEVKAKKNKPDWSAAPANKKQGKVISYWCFSPGFGLRDLVEHGIRSLILTSGTLSPLNSFAAELQVPFPLRLENPHIIGANQVLVGVLNRGPDDQELNSSYQNRSRPEYIRSLGGTIRNVAQMTPHGLLIFFPSYPVMKSCQENWQMSGLWDTIDRLKTIYVEPNSKEGFNEAMTGYYSAVQDPSKKGACFMAVCRGKVSEGLDFADMNGRVVIITGLPYPPARDPRVILKQRYLEENRLNPEFQGLSSTDWYRLEATRAVNQAIGRVIRHRNDYGAILLCDKRFGSKDISSQLSAWIRPHIKHYEKVGPLLRDIRNFFQDALKLLPQPEMKDLKTFVPNKNGNEDTSTSRQTSSVAGPAFEFSQTRSVQPSQTASASRASLFLNDFDVDIASYKQNKGASRTSQSQSDLFRELEPTQSVIDFNEISPSSTGQSTASSSVAPVPKRRKLKIVSSEEKRFLDSVAAVAQVASAKTEIPPAETPTSQTTFASPSEYLLHVKRSINKEEYAVFSKAVKDYKAVKDLRPLLRDLAALFLKEKSRHSFLLGFRHFIVKGQIEEFDKSCKELLAAKTI